MGEINNKIAPIPCILLTTILLCLWLIVFYLNFKQHQQPFFMCVDPVVQRLIDPNPGLKFNLAFIFLFFKSTFWYNFLYHF